MLRRTHWRAQATAVSLRDIVEWYEMPPPRHASVEAEYRRRTAAARQPFTESSRASPRVAAACPPRRVAPVMLATSSRPPPRRCHASRRHCPPIDGIV